MIDVDNVNSERIITLVNNLLESRNDAVRSRPILSKEEIREAMQDQISNENLDKILDNINKIIEASDIFNKKVQLRVNKDINRVIIIVVDKDSNKVIREIPCVELQNLAAHLQEAIGVLFDKQA
jgi:flagellar protein FlaG